MATPEPPDFAEVPNPMTYVPTSSNPATPFDAEGKFKASCGLNGPRVSVTRTEGGTTVVTRDTETGPSYFKLVVIEQVANGWMLTRDEDSIFGGGGVWVFPTKADLAKFITDKF